MFRLKLNVAKLRADWSKMISRMRGYNFYPHMCDIATTHYTTAFYIIKDFIVRVVPRL